MFREIESTLQEIMLPSYMKFYNLLGTFFTRVTVLDLLVKNN